MSNAQAITKQLVGAQIVTGTLDAMKQNKSGASSSMQGTAKLTSDVVGGALLGPNVKTSSSFDFIADNVDSKILDYKG